MLIRKAEFVKSSPALKDCPKPDRPEYAFIGRSNVGKSSLINMLCSHGSLAKTSATPGKTRLINHFSINGSWYLVDLPGYGYAKVSKSMLREFDRTIIHYIGKRDSLCYVFVLIDSRIPPQAIDLEFINTLGSLQIPLTLVFTKIDKTTQRERNSHIQALKDKLLETWEELPPCFYTSTITRSGREEILDFIEECNREEAVQNKEA
ncbi:MAG: ribosome biogenesis GTP-binding protein YihA/YsxC [Bacteroidales bacterium]|jgi:GTP-binding protein|nr:ribosome biogenesis GTP-binding protein YihA/YsxC [Bacteroidales bacterium]